MKAEDLMEALGSVKDSYIREAAPGAEKKKRTHFPWVAVAVIVAALAFFQTAPGAAALEVVKETVEVWIETLFPPRDAVVWVEGATEVVSQEAGGQLPQLEENGAAEVPGFAIYYDTERYEMVEEDGATYIRFRGGNDLPPCEMEIRHIPGLSPMDAAAAARETLAEQWVTLSPIEEMTDMGWICFSLMSGNDWDSPCGTAYFLSDGAEGSFQVISRYFLEAAEGHGVRFAQMLQSFTLIEP